MTQHVNTQIAPRLIRMRDIPIYLGMDKRQFNREVRKYLTEIPIGKQGIAFDRLELDAWVDYHKSRSGRPAANHLRGKRLWDVKKRQDFSKEENTGTLINKYMETAFEKALELSLLKKQNGT